MLTGMYHFVVLVVVVAWQERKWEEENASSTKKATRNLENLPCSKRWKGMQLATTQCYSRRCTGSISISGVISDTLKLDLDMPPQAGTNIVSSKEYTNESQISGIKVGVE